MRIILLAFFTATYMGYLAALKGGRALLLQSLAWAILSLAVAVVPPMLIMAGHEQSPAIDSVTETIAALFSGLGGFIAISYAAGVVLGHANRAWLHRPVRLIAAGFASGLLFVCAAMPINAVLGDIVAQQAALDERSDAIWTVRQAIEGIVDVRTLPPEKQNALTDAYLRAMGPVMRAQLDWSQKNRDASGAP